MNLRGDHCRCSGAPYGGCGEHFNSTYAFEHRTGSWSARRCLSVDEMRAKGMSGIATIVNVEDLNNQIARLPSQRRPG
jgi:hypothetical protein